MIIKTGLVLAATAATLLVTGCASQQPAPAQPVAMSQPVASCKGMAHCKQVIVQRSCSGT